MAIRFLQLDLDLSFRCLKRKKGDKTQGKTDERPEKKMITGENLLKKPFVLSFWKKIKIVTIVKYTCETNVFNQTEATIGGVIKTIKDSKILSVLFVKKLDSEKIIKCS